MTTKEEWLSQSRISSGLRCLYRYHLVEVEKLVPRYTPKPLRRGTLVHKGFEDALNLNFLGELDLRTLVEHGKAGIIRYQAEWLNGDNVKPFIGPELYEAGEQLAVDACQIFARSFTKLEVHERRWETVVAKDGRPMIEFEMSMPFAGWAGLRGTADWVAKERGTGHIWLFDFKTRKTLQPEGYDRLQLQHPTYLKLLRESEGLDLVGAATYQIRAAVRKRPKQLKNGSISRAACATDWETYHKAIVAAGLDPADYLDMKDSGKLSEFERLSYYHWTPDAVDRVFDSAISSAADLIEDQHRLADSLAEHGVSTEDAWPRALNPFNCRGCTHRSYCEADLRGEDTEFLAQTEYMCEGDTLVPEMELVTDGD